jgi:glycosyltransferase involved in cell wall biosynthesis
MPAVSEENEENSGIAEYRYLTLPHSGQISKIIEGLLYAKYEYVSLLDADDYYSATHLLETAKTFQSMENLDIVVSGHEVVGSEKKKVFSPQYKSIFACDEIKVETCGIVSALKGSRIQPTSCYAFRRSVIDKIVKNIPTRSRWDASADDLLITVAKLMRMRIMYRGRQSVFYRLHDYNQSQSNFGLLQLDFRLRQRGIFLAEVIKTLGLTDRMIVDEVTRAIPMNSKDVLHAIQIFVLYSANTLSFFYSLIVYAARLAKNYLFCAVAFRDTRDIYSPKE